jgi:hypothetical protein
MQQHWRLSWTIDQKIKQFCNTKSKNGNEKTHTSTKWRTDSILQTSTIYFVRKSENLYKLKNWVQYHQLFEAIKRPGNFKQTVNRNHKEFIKNLQLNIPVGIVECLMKHTDIDEYVSKK